MNLQQLEYIVALDKFRHFGKAAEHCKVTQPTLSTMVLKLEEELGAKLFDRSRQPIEPTSIGRKVLDQAIAVLRQSDIMREIVQNESDSLSGTIRFAILPTIAPYLLPRLLPALRQALPKLKITFIELKTTDCLDQLSQDDVDFALIASEQDEREYTNHLLYYEEFYGYVSRNEPLFKQDAVRSSEVNGASLWLLDEGHCFRDQLTKFCGLSRDSERLHRYSKGSLMSFMKLIEAGDGITFIPELALATLSKDRRELVRPFTIPRPTRGVYLCTRADFIRTTLRKRIEDIILQVVPQDMHRLKTTQTLV